MAPGPDTLLISARLHGAPAPEFGQLVSTAAFAKAEDGKAVRLNGHDEKLLYALPEDFGPDFTVAVRVRIREWPSQKHLGQIFSAWAAAGDDPLRLTIDGGKLFARVESDHAVSIGGVSLELSRWHHIAAVKAGTRLTLYVDGKSCATGETAEQVNTAARLAALGGNPLFTGAPEFLAADFSDFVVRNRALSEAEISALSGSATP